MSNKPIRGEVNTLAKETITPINERDVITVLQVQHSMAMDLVKELRADLERVRGERDRLRQLVDTYEFDLIEYATFREEDIVGRRSCLHPGDLTNA